MTTPNRSGWSRSTGPTPCRDPTRARFVLKFSSAPGPYAWGEMAVTHPIIGVDTRADFEYAPTEHILDYFPAQ